MRVFISVINPFQGFKKFLFFMGLTLAIFQVQGETTFDSCLIKIQQYNQTQSPEDSLRALDCLKKIVPVKNYIPGAKSASPLKPYIKSITSLACELKIKNVVALRFIIR
ncbi:MAG: hypothetical protein EBS07_00800 [Sphingobacteriia bacterium]|nr:hypothetical protein [Sphingobacteriia bacterium]